jgi:CheY-like chemotaxis protein
VGAGTSFHLLLPRSNRRPTPVPAPAASPPPAGAGGEAVLVVEDHAAVRDVTVRALTRRGYRVVAAADPEEALRLVPTLADDVRLVVTDVVMPGMSGPDMVQRLLAARPSLRVLYVSGYSQDALRQGAPGAGHDLLTKPFTPDELAGKVREILDRPR